MPKKKLERRQRDFLSLRGAPRGRERDIPLVRQ
jgi:hypothetical protein